MTTTWTKYIFTNGEMMSHKLTKAQIEYFESIYGKLLYTRKVKKPF